VLESPAEIAALAASGRPQSIVAFERRLHDGRSFEIRRTGLPDGGFVVTTTDKTAEVQAETMMRHAQRMEALGQLTGGIAHDFNNLLQVMISNLDLVAERLAEDRTLGRRIAAALRAAERGAAMTQQLLAFARRQPLAPVALDLDRVLAEVRELLHRSLGEAVDLQIVQSAGLWPAMADPAQLENVLVNLIVNARDAMPKGGKVTLETANVFLDEDDARQQDIAPGAYVMLAVTDTGEGMTAEVAARAFEPFFTTKEAGRGTGLGLSQVFGFIKQSGGHVKIDSEPGQGTSVKIYLPRAAAATAAGRVAGPSSLPSGTEAVLVVEDDEDVRAATAAQLQKLGYRTLVAGTAAEALAIIERGETIDLLFTDVVLPGGMRGGELAAEARRIRPAIAVLFTSGYTQNSIVHDGVLDPGALLLGKPYRLEALAAKLREALARAESPVDTRPL
jgi:signal transduction histidine kinase/ActR/RegA family two-component response regulator